MNIYWLLFILVGTLSVVGGIFWIIYYLAKNGAAPNTHAPSIQQDFVAEYENGADHIFNDEFREELKNRGRLHFEKIINDNAMFLKQDLQLTASQLNEYMQESIKKVLKEEFHKYEESIQSAKDLAIESIEKTRTAIEEQRAILRKELEQQIAAEKKADLDKFEKNMAEVVNHYLLEALGSEIDLTSQLDYIMRHLEDNKEAIVEDMRSGA